MTHVKTGWRLYAILYVETKGNLKNQKPKATNKRLKTRREQPQEAMAEPKTRKRPEGKPADKTPEPKRGGAPERVGLERRVGGPMKHKSCGRHDRTTRENPWWGRYQQTMRDGELHYYWSCPWCHTCIVVSESEYNQNGGSE